jgi:hypothetical protein
MRRWSMHSRVFVLSTDRDTNPGDLCYPWEDNPQYLGPTVDYVVPSETFKDDIGWLEETYGIKVSWDGDKPYLSTEALKKVEEELKADLQKRLDEVEALIRQARKGEVETDSWLLYRISQVAWERLGFFFFVDGDLRREPEFLEYIQYNGYDHLWVIATYDYHF